MKVLIFGFLILFLVNPLYTQDKLTDRFKAEGVAIDKAKMRYSPTHAMNRKLGSVQLKNKKKNSFKKNNIVPSNITRGNNKDTKDSKKSYTSSNYSKGSTINNGSNSAYRYNSNKTVQTKVNGEMVSAPIMTPVPDPIVHLRKVGNKTKINLDYNDVELGDIIKYISDITDTNFIVPANLKGKKITIISPKKVTAREALSAFFTVLAMNNYSVVKAGKYYKIIPMRDANKPNFVYYQNQRVPNVDYLVTKIYNLKYAKLRDVENLINKMKSRDGKIASYEPTSMLIFTDTGRSINNIFKIVKQIDVPTDTMNKVWLVPVYYAEARDLSKKIEDIFDLKRNKSKKNKTPRISTYGKKGKSSKKNVAKLSGDESVELNIDKVLYDERTNQLIIKSDKASKLKLLKLIKKLDIPLEDDSTIHVYYLKNAKADEIASTINSLSSGSSRRSSSKSRIKKSPAHSLGGGVMFQGEVKVTADKPTNTLVVVASAKDYNALRKVIELLDLKRKQVYVEAVIMEISIDKMIETGVSANGGYQKNVNGSDVPMFGGTSLGGLSSMAVNPAALTGFAFGAMSSTSIKITDAISIPAFGVILKALETNNDVNVLSSPQVLTMDNEEAEFVVGENVPFPSGISNGISGGTSGGAYIPVVSIQRQDVAIKLKITPQISGDNQVKLEVNQEITEVKGSDPILGPTTSKRQIKTTVVVPDQQTIVIGGLIKDNTTITENKVPVLGDIPVLGFFFKYKKSRVSKSNLLIFLTPYIIRNAADMDKIWNKKREDFEEFKRLKKRVNEGFDIFVDYNKKRGLVSEINYSVKKFEEKVKLYEASKEKTDDDKNGDAGLGLREPKASEKTPKNDSEGKK